ncbi:hypothetical protein NG782_09440 [Aliarcobacter cryaerophilus]|uniref:hypothetical protein n=1 Tax=Aliarcobacter cryaerophilus TaxID=28198 RepID=UPI003DA25B95
MNILEEELEIRYKDLDNLNSNIEHLEANDIDDEDKLIQIELNHFLDFKTTLTKREINVIDIERDIILLKLVKLKLTILYKIKHKLPDKKIRQKSNIQNLEKRYLDVKELEYIYGVSEKMQNTLREKNMLQCTQLVPNGKVLYEVNYIEEYMQKFTTK